MTPTDVHGGRLKMADITMCAQTLCPNAAHCYRIQAAPGAWQSWAAFTYKITASGTECDHYLPWRGLVKEG